MTYNKNHVIVPHMARLDGILHVPSPFQYWELNAEPPVSRQVLSVSWITNPQALLD